MTGGPDLPSAPLAQAVLARWSWRPAGAQGAQRLMGGLAAPGSPMLARARGLQAWHDGLARRWRPVDAAQPALTVSGADPASAGGRAAPSSPIDDPAAGRGSPERGRASRRAASASRRAAPVRIEPISAARSRAQRLPLAAPAPARPALTIAALAARSATAATPLPVPFRSSTPAASAAADPPAGGLELLPAIGRRFPRREVAGGFPDVRSRGPAGGGESPATRPTAPIVRWRVIGGTPSEDPRRRAGAGLRSTDRDGGHRVAPALPPLGMARPLPAQRTAAMPDRATADADLAERHGASEASALSGLSVRLVTPEEAARRLAHNEDATGRDGAPGAPSEAGARRASPPGAAKATIDIDVIVERVQRELTRRERFERERKGLL